MKNTYRISIIFFFIVAGFAAQEILAVAAPGRKKSDQQNILTIRGKVVDSETGTPLIFASVAVKETNVATVTNIDGEFLIKISETDISRNLEITYLGYKNKIIPLTDLREEGYKNAIELSPAPIPIREIIVRPLDPEEIVKTAINNDLRFDGARLYKGRKSSDVDRMDTILFKLQGGPVSVLQLDIAKNTEAILTIDAMKYYDYRLSGVLEIDEKPHYIIDFKQKPHVDIPLFMGSFFIEIDTYALTEAEFGFNLEDKDAAASIFIRKKPLGMNVTPEIATYRTKYRAQDGKMYFAYSRAEVRFKVNWKKKLFNTNYTTMSEIAVTDRTTEEVIKIPREEKIRYSDVFSEKVGDFVDPEFWGDYNVIEPDQSIESAIRRLSRRLKFSDRE